MFIVTIWAKILPVTFTPIFDGGAMALIGIKKDCMVLIDVVADTKAVTAGAIDNP